MRKKNTQKKENLKRFKLSFFTISFSISRFQDPLHKTISSFQAKGRTLLICIFPSNLPRHIVYLEGYYTDTGSERGEAFFFPRSAHSPRHRDSNCWIFHEHAGPPSQQCNNLSAFTGTSLTFENEPVRLCADKRPEVPMQCTLTRMRCTIFVSLRYNVKIYGFIKHITHKNYYIIMWQRKIKFYKISFIKRIYLLNWK